MIPVWLYSPERLTRVREGDVAYALGEVVKAARALHYPDGPLFTITRATVPLPTPRRSSPRGWRRYRRQAKAQGRHVPRSAKRWPPRALRRRVARDAREALRAHIDAALLGVSVNVVWREGGTSSAREMGFK